MQETMRPVQSVEEHVHPGPRVYVIIAVILAVITLIEVAIFYLPELLGQPGLWPVLVAAFLLLSAGKFVTVVGYYMHLKFDAKLFRGVFGFFLLTAMTIAIAFIALFHGFYFF